MKYIFKYLNAKANKSSLWQEILQATGEDSSELRLDIMELLLSDQITILDMHTAHERITIRETVTNE